MESRLADAGRARTPRLSGSQDDDSDPPDGVLEEVMTRSSSNRGQEQAVVRFVVADDHAVVRRGAISWLHAQPGYKVVGEAETAKEALAQAILHMPHVVLLDVNLHGESGLCAAGKIVRNCPRTEVVAFSASADPVHVRGMFAAGAKAYVLKTSESSAILGAIRAVLAGSRFLDPGLSDTLVEELALFHQGSHRVRDVLTAREAQVLQYIVWGYTSRDIATALSIKPTTANTYRYRLSEKLGLCDRAEIVRYGCAMGLMTASTAAVRPPASPARTMRGQGC